MFKIITGFFAGALMLTAIICFSQTEYPIPPEWPPEIPIPIPEIPIPEDNIPDDYHVDHDNFMLAPNGLIDIPEEWLKPKSDLKKKEVEEFHIIRCLEFLDRVYGERTSR